MQNMKLGCVRLLKRFTVVTVSGSSLLSKNELNECDRLESLFIITCSFLEYDWCDGGKC